MTRIARTELAACTVSLVFVDGFYEVAVLAPGGGGEEVVPMFRTRYVDVALARFRAEETARGVEASVIRFEAGETYRTSSICDSDCIFTMHVLSRTAKTIKTLTGGDPRTYRIYERDGVERVSMGSYSMAAQFRATRKERAQC